jgi:TonB family protein
MNDAAPQTIVTMQNRASKFVMAALLLACSVASAQDTVEQVDSSTDRMPRNTVVPDYPEIARRDRIEGEVQVCFEITRDGRPRRIAVRTSTNRLFEKPARKAVRNSTWAPLKDGEKASDIKACRTFRFSLVPRENSSGSVPQQVQHTGRRLFERRPKADQPIIVAGQYGDS